MSGAPERYAVAACRQRWLEFLELGHATLAPPVDFGRDGEDLVVWRARVAARPVGDRPVPPAWRAPLLLQAASAAAFFGARGFPLSAGDLEAAAWDATAGTARLWLTRTPAMVGDGADDPPARALLAFLQRLFARGGRLTHSAARGLARELAAPEAERLRGELWVARVIDAFPELCGPAASAARERCLGIGSLACAGLSVRVLVEKARAVLRGRQPRVFAARGSGLTPGGALALDPPPASAAEASARLRALAGDVGGAGATWIAVASESWDTLSRRAFDAAALAAGERVEVVTVVPEAAPPETPAEWRRALWVPCGTVAASVRFYEWFSTLARAEPLHAHDRMRRVLAGPGWAEFAADPTGDAPLPSAGGPITPPPPQVRSGEDDPGARIEGLLFAGRTGDALREAERWVRAFPDRPAEAWFSLSARLSAAPLEQRPAWLEAIEAEREVAGGRAREAFLRLERIGRISATGSPERRRARLRAAEVAVMLGRHGDAARRAAAWRREHPDAPVGEGVRALRLGAAGLSREGRTDCALALLEEADRLGGAAEGLETGLARGRVFALAGRFAEEDAVYDALRPVALASRDERLAAAFLAQEARGLLDRKEYARAAVRLEEAIAIARDDPGERSALMLDLAVTAYHGGDAARCEALLEESREAAAAAGREDLAHIARANRVELLINRCAWEEAAREIDALETAAAAERDEPRQLVALHHRGRLAVRRGHLAEAARASAAAFALAERLGDRLEIGELHLELGDRLLYEKDLDGARLAWQSALAGPPDRCGRDRAARERLAELSFRSDGGPPASAWSTLEERFTRDPYGAAETVARWHSLLGPAGVPGALVERAAVCLRAAGGHELADRVFGPAAEPVPAEAIREVRDAVRAALLGEAGAGHEALARIGIGGLSVCDADGRTIVGLGTGPAPSAAGRSVLEAGGARFELALWPQPPRETAEAIALVLETLLFRAAVEPPHADFAEGWMRLGVVTADASMEEPYRRLTRFAPQPLTVLILGESGSGKEAVARAIHRLSPRAAGPFVAVNVPAIPPALVESELFGHARGAFTGAERERRGLLEEAAAGTIFLDEIGDLDLPLQAKLLRALQEREVRRVGENRSRAIDVRVVSATSRDLEREVEAGRFREDLYYRLHVATIRLPPLRERGSDTLRLARHFLERSAREYGRGRLHLAPEAAAAVRAYSWPGNVRELENAMAQAAALGDPDGAVPLSLLPRSAHPPRPPGAPAGDYRARVDAHRRDLIADALDKAGGNRSRAARDLGLSRQALHYLMRELRVDAPKRS